MKATLLFCALLALPLVAAAQNPPTMNAQANTVYVSAEGKYESAPDTATVQFTISAQEQLAKDAYSRASQETEQLRQILRSTGIDSKSAEIGFFSMQPVYDYRNPQRKVVGFRVTASISVKLKDFAKVGALVGAIGDQEWAENLALNYTLEDIDAAKLRAVDDAFQRARAEAAAVARAGGRSLGELSYASVDTYEQVRVLAAPMAAPRAMTAQTQIGPPTAEFSPHKVSVSARVSTMFALK